MGRPVNKTRNVTKEYDLGRAAAERDVLDGEVVDLPAIKKSAYTHGYARALMDVADGKVKAPKPVWTR
jgi:hypothetical protein